MSDKVDKKEAILEAMLGLIVERGLHDAPMSELAKRSGASPGVIYHYFPSKEDIIHAVYRRASALKHEVLLEGYSDAMSPREAFFTLWLNGYGFYRKYLNEARFLDQYLHSTYCNCDPDKDSAKTPSMQRLMKLWRPASKGGVLKDLPDEVIKTMTFGVAADLARAPKKFSPATLAKVAETVWMAIADEQAHA